MAAGVCSRVASWISLLGQGVLCAEARRRRPSGAAHGARTGSDPRRGRRGAGQRVHPDHARHVEQLPWRGVPFLPVEIVLLPRWFPFHLQKVSYWSRTVMVPLAVLCSLKVHAQNPRGVSIRELFVTPPEKERDYFPVRSRLNRAFTTLDALGRAGERKLPASRRRIAHLRAARWFIGRLNGADGLGGIFPAMVNAYEALAALGYGYDHPYRVQARTALRRLFVPRGDATWCQPCVSPVWDTALATLALQEVAAGAPTQSAIVRWIGSSRVSCPTQRPVIGEPSDLACAAVDGHFNSPIRTIPISTIPLRSPGQ